MSWTGDQLPWNVSFSKPPNPSGQFEALNWMKGPPVLAKSVVSGLPSGPPVLCPGRLSSNTLSAMQSKPPVIYGIGHKPYYPNMNTIRYLYNPTILPGMSSLITALRIKGP